MKKLLKYIFLLPVVALAASCAKEEIFFDHEKPSFEVKDGMILLEAMVPSVLAEGDGLYIAGEFNGGDKAALANPAYRLEKATDNNKKYGIYLDPASFIDDKSLSDGFHFVSSFRGAERSGKGDEVTHSLNATPGNGYIEYIASWECAFLPYPDDLETEGIMITVDNQTGWDNLYLYATDANTGSDVFGARPGILPAGKINKNNKIHWYYDTGADNVGKTVKAVFNNGASASIAEYNMTLDKTNDIIVKTTGVESALYPSHAGTIRIYVEYDKTGWNDLKCYMHGTVNDLGGGWPGAGISGTETINGKKYSYFEYSVSEVAGNEEHLIFNNGEGTQIPGTQEPTLTFSNDNVDYFYLIYKDLTTVTIDPYDRDNDPQPEEPTFSLQVEDLTGWNDLYVFDAGKAAIFGEWPGLKVSEETSESEIYGTVMKIFNVSTSNIGSDVELWINNNSNAYAIYGCTLQEDSKITVTPTEAFEFNDTPRIYVEDRTGWKNMTLYTYEEELFGEWPGTAPSGTALTTEGVSRSVFIVDEEHIGKTTHIIFNNNDDDELQLDGPEVTVDRSLEYRITSEEFEDTSIKRVPVHIYIANNTGWEQTFCYSWGDGKVFGEWPGTAVPTETVSIGGQKFSVLTISEEYFGTTCHLIFNNNSGGIQFDGPVFTAEKDIFLSITADSYEEFARPDSRVYVNDQTGWDVIRIYAWGDAEIFGGWPGAAPAGTEEIEGTTWKYFTISSEYSGFGENLIFNDNGKGVQTPEYHITTGSDLFLNVTSEGATPAE